MTYLELIERAAVTANRSVPEQPLGLLRARAETIFPSIVEELAQSVAANLNHPWRSVIGSVTDTLADGALIPETDENDIPIIGLYGLVRDSEDGENLTDVFSASEIRRLNQNPGDWRKIPVYAFAIVKPRIYHTRTTVTIDVCVLDEAAIATAIAADQVPLFPDAEGAYVTALVNKLLTPAAKFDVDYFRQLTVV